jgi:hypothetical protein
MKPAPPSDLIRSIIDEFSVKLEEAIRTEVQERLRSFADGMGKDGQGKVAGPVYLKGRKNIPDHCRHPGCNEPHFGARYGYFCEEHRPERYLKPGSRSKRARRREQQSQRERQLEETQTTPPPVLTAVPGEAEKKPADKADTNTTSTGGSENS